MAKAKKGDLLSCEVCGLIVTVDEACGCATIDELICCGQPMGKGKAAAKKARKAAAAAAAPAAKKAVTKKAKPAAKKAVTKKAKPAAKKKAAPKKKVAAKKPAAKAKKK